MSKMSKIISMVICLGSSILTSCTSAEEVKVKRPLAVGEHPRLMFTKADLPKIRARAKTPEGQEIVKYLKTIHARYDSQLKKQDPEWLKKMKKDAPNLLGKFQKPCREIALLYVVTGDKKIGQTARKLFKIWLDSYPPTDKLKATNSWGEPEYAMVYDWIYNLLTEEERKRARAIFASRIGKPTREMMKTSWWYDGPCVSNRNATNWTPICTSGIGLTVLATEGEIDIPSDMTQKAIVGFRDALNDGIAADGGMYEGTQYPMGYGTDRVPFMLMALRLRGIDLINQERIKNVPVWFTYEMLPWGGQAQAMNKSGGDYFGGSFPTFLSSEFEGPADWIAYYAIGHKPGPLQQKATVALLNGIPNPSNKRPNHLPLSHWFSTNGKIISRSGWGPKDAHFVCSTNSLGAGHSNADQGTFCYADDGINYIADSGVLVYATEEHNVILVDGQGQPQREASTESFTKSFDSSKYADIADMDLRLGYGRVLTGLFTGPWHWIEHLPLERADRLGMFVRGLSGPLLIMADDFRKDDKSREYSWRIHSVWNNQFTTHGRRFKITPRYCGKFIESLGKGQKASFVKKNISKGTYRGWLLVRGVPYSRRWSNTTVWINGKKAPYNTTYIQLGNHGSGWHWVPIMLHGRDKSPYIKLPEEKLEIKFESVTGAQIAMAAFSKDFDWQPSFDPIPDNRKFIVLDCSNLKNGTPPWQEKSTEPTVLTGVFLGNKAPLLKTDISKATKQPYLDAIINADQAKYLCAMFSAEKSDNRLLDMPINGNGQLAVIHSPKGFDLVSGTVDEVPTKGDLTTDATAVCVSMTEFGTPETIKAYALAKGKNLSYKGKALVKTDSNVHVINDGTSLLVRGKGGETVECNSLTADKLIINGKSCNQALPKNKTIKVQVPKLPKKWDVKLVNNGKTVIANGDGPLPLIVQAPKAIQCIINGVERWFVKDRKGNIYPTLRNGTELYQFDFQLSPEKLKKATVSGNTKLEHLESENKQVLEIDDKATLNLNTPAPAIYRVSLKYAMAKPGKVDFIFNGIKTTVIVKKVTDSLINRGFDGIKVEKGLKMEVNTQSPVQISQIILNPALKKIVANKWKIIGPFPSSWSSKKHHDWRVKEALQTPYPPEKEIDFNASYQGADGKKIRWQDCKPAQDVKFDLDKGVTFKQIGVYHKIRGQGTGKICYAVTFINSPDDRKALLKISCDYWANAYLNGDLVKSEVNRDIVEKTGAEFPTSSPIQAELNLQKGLNTLLVKCHGGTGGNRFVGFITDPGDLTISSSK